jgi:hypothetical protein
VYSFLCILLPSLNLAQAAPGIYLQYLTSHARGAKSILREMVAQQQESPQYPAKSYRVAQQWESPFHSLLGKPKA